MKKYCSYLLKETNGIHSAQQDEMPGVYFTNNNYWVG